jgi:nucleotide-binding universal stress UspA family protein
LITMTATTTPAIVCGLDGGPSSLDLARVAARLADMLGARLEAVHVLGARDVPARVAHEAGEAEGLAMLDAVCDAIGGGAAVRHVVRYGDPARRVSMIAEEAQAELIVVGARERGGGRDALLGSVSSRLAADAPCPVLVVPPDLAPGVRPEEWRGRTLVCGYDGSGAALNAALRALPLAGRLGGSLRVVSVGPGTRVRADRLMSRLRAALRHSGHAVDGGGVELAYEARVGDPAWVLERVAATSTSPLLVVGSRGAGPWRDGLLGDTARGLLRAARRPTLVVPAVALLDNES